jgi:hypothetical protein
MRSKSPLRSRAARSFFFTIKRFNIFLLPLRFHTSSSQFVIKRCRLTPARWAPRLAHTGEHPVRQAWAGDSPGVIAKATLPRPPAPNALPHKRTEASDQTGGGCSRNPQPTGTA